VSSGSGNNSNEKSASKGTLSTSRSLLIRLRDDDDDAWSRMVDLYTPLVCYWCRRLNLPDVLQEIFRAVASNIARFRKDRPGDTFRGWLRTISRSKVMDSFRHQGREAQATGGTDAQMKFAHVPDPQAAEDTEEPDEDDSSSDEDSERHLLFQRALQIIQTDFHERTWQAFWKVAVEGLPVADVADELSMKPGTVRVARCRVLARLRSEFGDLLQDDTN
jgi:RNA polymerase sigma-70 factor (ECF subfamily)